MATRSEHTVNAIPVPAVATGRQNAATEIPKIREQRKRGATLLFTVRVVRHWHGFPQRSCGCPLPGSVQGQVGWSSEQPGLVEDVPAHGRGVGTR